LRELSGLRRLAFTLAEVLIVVGLIGIVAESTIPTLINNFEEKVAAVQLKKTFSSLSQAFMTAVSENGTPDGWDLKGNDSAPGAENLINMLAKYMRFTKNCGRNPGCFPDVTYATLMTGDTYTNLDSGTRFAKAQLSDGSIVAALIESETCSKVLGTSDALQNGCGWLYIDVNGLKKPNRLGYDLFEFNFTKLGIIPAGSVYETSDTFLDECSRSGGNGFGCAAWVIDNQNMEYKKCNGLSWFGRKVCN